MESDTAKGGLSDRLGECSYSETFYINESVIADHRVNRQYIVSGACQLGSLLGDRSPVKRLGPIWLEDIKFLGPLIVKENAFTLCVNIEPWNEVSLRFEIGDEKGNISATGKITVVNESLHDHAESLEKYSIISDGMNLNRRQIKTFFERRGTYYGEAYQGLSLVSCGQEAVIGHIDVSDKNLENFQRFGINPTLFDGALQTIIGYIEKKQINEDEGYIYIPFSFKRVKVSKLVAPKDRFYSRVNNIRLANKGAMLLMDITVVNAEGIRVLDIEAFTMVKIRQKIS